MAACVSEGEEKTSEKRQRMREAELKSRVDPTDRRTPEAASAASIEKPENAESIEIKNIYFEKNDNWVMSGELENAGSVG